MLQAGGRVYQVLESQGVDTQLLVLLRGPEAHWTFQQFPLEQRSGPRSVVAKTSVIQELVPQRCQLLKEAKGGQPSEDSRFVISFSRCYSTGYILLKSKPEGEKWSKIFM